MVDVKMGAHHIVDLIDRDTGVRQPFLEAVAVHHVLGETRRAWLMITDATVDQDAVVRGLLYDAVDGAIADFGHDGGHVRVPRGSEEC
jgi:hypothetical protein